MEVMMVPRAKLFDRPTGQFAGPGVSTNSAVEERGWGCGKRFRVFGYCFINFSAFMY